MMDDLAWVGVASAWVGLAIEFAAGIIPAATGTREPLSTVLSRMALGQMVFSAGVVLIVVSSFFR